MQHSEGREAHGDRVRKSHSEHRVTKAHTSITRCVREEDKERKGGGGHERSKQHMCEML